MRWGQGGEERRREEGRGEMGEGGGEGDFSMSCFFFVGKKVTNVVIFHIFLFCFHTGCWETVID